MRINLDPGNGNFNQNDKEFKVPYHDYFFLENGMLEKITNTNPPPYLPQRLIEFHRTENTLSFKLHSKKEIFLQKIVKSGDKLIWLSYDKLDDSIFGYHSKKYINKTFVKHGDFYSQHSEDVGKNKRTIYSHWDYEVINNKQGHDSLVYLKQKNQPPYLLYSVKYRKYDKHGNWLIRQFISKNNSSYIFCDYTEYRKIEYYK